MKSVDKIDLDFVCINQQLSEEFMEKFKDSLNWSLISVYQKLNETFIHRFVDYVDWIFICEYQVLSQKFIEEHEKYIDWTAIGLYQVLDETFLKKYNNKFGEVTFYFEDSICDSISYNKNKIAIKIDDKIFYCYGTYLYFYFLVKKVKNEYCVKNKYFID